MKTKESLHGYVVAEQQAEDHIEDLRYQIDKTRQELLKLESKLVGAKEVHEQAKERLRRFKERTFQELITDRDVEIAALKGIHVSVGEVKTPQLKYKIYIEEMIKS